MGREGGEACLINARIIILIVGGLNCNCMAIICCIANFPQEPQILMQNVYTVQREIFAN